MFFPLLAEKRTSFFHQRYFFLDCLHGMFHNFCLLTSEKRPPFALVLKTQNILKTIQKQSLNMRRAEISEKFSVTLWACLHNGNPAKQQLDELSAPAGQNKKVYAQKNNLLTTFSSGLGLSPRCLRQLHTPKVKRKVPVFAGTLLVAGAGFEPYDLRVMSPMSYQTALPRDICALQVSLFTLLQFCAFVKSFVSKKNSKLHAKVFCKGLQTPFGAIFVIFPCFHGFTAKRKIFATAISAPLNKKS